MHARLCAIAFPTRVLEGSVPFIFVLLNVHCLVTTGCKFYTCLTHFVQVQELVKLGGKDARTATRRMLAYLLDDQLASLFSWFGRKGKLSFSTLKISSSVTGKL